jgi:hypothetical protein
MRLRPLWGLCSPRIDVIGRSIPIKENEDAIGAIRTLMHARTLDNGVISEFRSL